MTIGSGSPELHEAQLRFESKISDLRRQLTESVEECHLLRKRQAENEDFPDKIQELEHKLQEALKQNEDFEEQMEAVENEKEDCQRIIDELKADVDRLQKVIQDLELQVCLAQIFECQRVVFRYFSYQIFLLFRKRSCMKKHKTAYARMNMWNNLQPLSNYSKNNWSNQVSNLTS